MGAVAAREVLGQCGQGDRLEALQQQCLGVGESGVEGGIDRLFDQAFRVLVAVAHGEQRRFAERFMQLTQGDLGQVGGNAPATGMPPAGRHQTCFPQQSHGAPNHDWMGAEALRQCFGRHWSIALSHMQKGVEYGGESAVSFHVTNNVTFEFPSQAMNATCLLSVIPGR